MSGAAAVAELLDHLVSVGGAVWRASWQASVLAVLVVAVQLIFGRRISARWRHAMWMLVLVRLALPVVPSSPLSVFNLASAGPKTPETRDVERVTHVTIAAPAMGAPLAASRTNTPSSAEPRPDYARGSHAAQLALSAPAPGLWSGWPQVLASLWLVGACVLALRIAWATHRVSRVMRRLDRVADDATLAVLRATADELNVRRLPTLLAGDGLFSPALVGFIRPKLLVPRDLLVRFDARELRLIFLHELAHLKRRDVAINWAATLLTVLHWMNPIVWLVTWRLRLERELACDELVLSCTGDADRRAYGHTIVKLLETFSRDAKPLPGGVGILEGKQQMKRRIIMIAQFAKNGRTWTVVAALLVLGLGLVALTDAVQAEEPTPTTRPAPAVLRQEVIVTADGQRIPTDNYVRSEPADASAGAKIKPGDLVTVSVMNLVAHGVETMKTTRVDDDGNISLPHVGQVTAKGLKPNELEAAVSKTYAKGGMHNALVAVSLPERGESHQLAAHRQTVPGGFDPAMMEMDPAMMPPDGIEASRLMLADPNAAPSVDPAMQAVLDKKLPEVKFDGIPLSDVIDFLRDVTSSNIFVNWRAVQAAGVDRGAPVSLNVRDVAFKDVLSLILREQGDALQYKIENGVITIDAPDAPVKAPKLITKAYDVRDLLTVPQAPGAFGGGEMNVNPMTPAAGLTSTIFETVVPESWRANGGAGNISAYGTKLIVTASDEVHREVANLLDMLRDKPATQPATAVGRLLLETGQEGTLQIR